MLTMKSNFRHHIFLVVFPLVFLAVNFSVLASKSKDETKKCPCKLASKPKLQDKALTARWMVHSLDWGTLSTVSTRLDGGVFPFGNTYSFVDGTCGNSTGVPYFYGTYMDQSLADSVENPLVSFSLTEASLSSVCNNRDGLAACTLGTKYGDPESPVCARVALTGELVVVDEDDAPEEYQMAISALFKRHSTMEYWPNDHNWVVFKIEIQDIWLIDYFGGASIISPDDYFATVLQLDEEEE